jgi:hypothetical protein
MGRNLRVSGLFALMKNERLQDSRQSEFILGVGLDAVPDVIAHARDDPYAVAVRMRVR